MNGGKSFPVWIDFESVLRAISKQIYETPLAFIRENVQNAVDAVRIQAHRDKADPGDARYGVDVWERYGEDLRPFADQGLVEYGHGRLRLTRRGMLLANEVMSVFV